MKKLMKKMVLCLTAIAMAVSTMIQPLSASAEKTSSIDNSSLLPAYVPDAEVAVDTKGWPEWTKDLIIAEVNIRTATEKGTLAAMDQVLDHLAEMGVNCLWVDPIGDMGLAGPGVGYTNYGPHSICPYLTGQIAYGQDYAANQGKVNYEAGFQEFKKFVDRAHERNIRILVDMVTWGTSPHSPLVTEHKDFYTGENSHHGGPEFDWESETLNTWYKEQIKNFLLVTGADGIRFDLEPQVAGYTIFEEIRNELNAEGRKPLFISEAANDRANSFAFEQYGSVKVLDRDKPTTQEFCEVFLDGIDLVQSIKTGKNIGAEMAQLLNESGRHQYYSYQISCHDGLDYFHAPIAAWGYEFLYSSFIPIFYIGEEWNAEKTSDSLYGSRIDWTQLDEPEHREYYETVKNLIAIRWKYKEILNMWPENHRDTNITTVELIGTERTNGYARYKDNQALIVVPNVNEYKPEDTEMTITVPFKDTMLDGYKSYTVTNLLTNEVIAEGTADKVEAFKQTIPYNDCGLYLVQGNGERVVEAEPDEPEPVKEETFLDTVPTEVLALAILGSSALIGILILLAFMLKNKKNKQTKVQKENSN